jgi:hypothetical protein
MDQKLGLGGTKVRQCRQMMAEEMSSVEAAEAVNWSRPRLPANGLQPSLTGCVLYAIPSPRPCLGSVVLEIRRGVPVFGIRCRAGVVSYPPCGAPLCVVFVLGQWEMAISCAEGLQRRSFSLASFLELSLVSQGIHNPENSMSGSQAGARGTALTTGSTATRQRTAAQDCPTCGRSKAVTPTAGRAGLQLESIPGLDRVCWRCR